MRKLFYLIFVLTLLPSGCLTDSDENDCICTEEFRTITVMVVDEQDNFVDDLNITVKDASGKTYDVSDVSLLNGYYPVMSDAYVQEFTTEPKKILFTGVKDTLSVTGEFFINTDDCQCHINKVRGPDTLVIK